jgi:tetratricopeptide (TPR) repeat protein
MSNDNNDEFNPSEPLWDEPEDLTHLEETQLSPNAPDDLAETQAFLDDDSNDAEIQEQEALPSDTQPIPAQKKKRGGQWMKHLGVYVSIFLAILAISAFGGFRIALYDRQENEKVQRARVAAEQYQLAMQNMQDGDYSTAVQRLEYVIKMYPSFPGAPEQLSLALLASQSTATPTAMPTATIEPTPDNRAAEELFQQAVNSSNAEDWDTVMNALDTLRNTKPDFRTVDVDGLYYIALRNRGVKKIGNGDLEGGIFDITQAEKIAPLDGMAVNYRQWAEWYLTGASFWEVDWDQAYYYFSQIVPMAPNLMDSNFITAQQRLATAQVYAATTRLDEVDYYIANKYWCTAHDIFVEAAANKPLDAEMVPTAQYIASKCELNPNSYAP